MELVQVKNKVDVTHDGKHDHKQGIEDEEIHEISNHFTHDLDEWTDFWCELDDVNDFHDQASDHYREEVLKFIIDVLLKVSNYSEFSFLGWNTFSFNVVENALFHPIDGENRYYEEGQICEEANRWEWERSIKLSQEYELNHLSDEEHQVEVTEDVDDTEGIVDAYWINFDISGPSVQLL